MVGSPLSIEPRALSHSSQDTPSRSSTSSATAGRGAAHRARVRPQRRRTQREDLRSPPALRAVFGAPQGAGCPLRPGVRGSLRGDVPVSRTSAGTGPVRAVAGSDGEQWPRRQGQAGRELCALAVAGTTKPALGMCVHLRGMARAELSPHGDPPLGFWVAVSCPVLQGRAGLGCCQPSSWGLTGGRGGLALPGLLPAARHRWSSCPGEGLRGRRVFQPREWPR